MQAVGRVGTQQFAGRRVQFNLGQLGCVFHKCAQGNLRPGQNHPANQASLGIHGQHRRSGIHMDDKQRRGVPAQSADRCTEQFRPELRRVVHTDAHAAAQPGPHLKHRGLGHLAQSFPHPAGDAGHHAAQYYALNVQR